MMTIGRKLVLAFLAVAVGVSFGTGVIAWQGTDRLGRRIQSMHDDGLVPLLAAHRLEGALVQADDDVYRAVNAGPADRDAALAALRAAGSEFLRRLEGYEERHMTDAQPELRDLLRRYGALEDQSGRERQALADLHAAYPGYQRRGQPGGGPDRGGSAGRGPRAVPPGGDRRVRAHERVRRRLRADPGGAGRVRPPGGRTGRRQRPLAPPARWGPQHPRQRGARAGPRPPAADRDPHPGRGHPPGRRRRPGAGGGARVSGRTGGPGGVVQRHDAGPGPRLRPATRGGGGPAAGQRRAGTPGRREDRRATARQRRPRAGTGAGPAGEAGAAPGGTIASSWPGGRPATRCGTGT